MQGTDSQVTATMKEDYADLWKEDVHKCSSGPTSGRRSISEYEISPLGYELPIFVPKLDGKFLGWRPWNYDGERK